jgi:hypothetical protein
MAEAEEQPPVVWRTKLRSLKPGVDHAEQVAHNFDSGIVGLGWGIEELPSRARLVDVLEAIGCGPGGRRFESGRAPLNWLLRTRQRHPHTVTSRRTNTTAAALAAMAT